MTGEAWLTVDARCPTCGRRPAIRIPPEERARAATLPPSTPMLSYECRKRDCGRYPIPAAAYQRAS
jgi:hypothetical protein